MVRGTTHNLKPPNPCVHPRGVLTTLVPRHLIMPRNGVIPANAGGVLMDRMLSYVAKQSPGEQDKRGDRRLDEARTLIVQNELVIDSRDLEVIEDRIAL